MRNVTAFSLRNAFALVLGALLLLAGGAYTAIGMNQQEMPNIDFPYVSVTTVYPGATPQDVQDRISGPLARALDHVDGLKNIYATSVANFSAITLEFNLDSDVADDRTKVEEAIRKVTLPDTAEAPSVSTFSFSDAPVLDVSLLPKGAADMDAFRDWARNGILPQLQGLPGVGEVDVAANLDRTLEVRLDPDKLAANGMTAQSVAQLLQAANLALPAGAVSGDGGDMNVRVTGNLRSLEDLRNLRLPVVPSERQQMSNALAPMIESIRQMGSAMGTMGKNLSQLGNGVGVLAAQTALLNTKQDLAMALVADRQALAAAQDQRQQALLQQKIQQEETNLAKIDAQLKSLQAQMKQLGAAIQGGGQAAGTTGSTAGSAADTGTAAGASTAPVTLDTVRLGDLGTIEMAAPAATVVTRLNGEPSLDIQVLQASGANPEHVADGVLAKLHEIADAQAADAASAAAHPFSIEIVQNAADNVRASVGGMEREAALGAIFAALIIFLFLRRWRATLIAVLAIPLSIAAALLVLAAYGISLNTMSLAGLAVAVGRVVDDAIVVTENIHRHARASGYTFRSVVAATTEVASAITASTITTIVVFAPLGLVGGIVGRVFQPFAVTVVAALIASLLVALTLVPAVTWLLARNRGVLPGAAAGAAAPTALADDKASGSASYETPFVRRYRGWLNWLLNHRLVSTVVLLAIFASSLTVIPALGTSFLPAQERPTVQVKAHYPEGTPLHQMDRQSLAAERTLMKNPDVSQIEATIGSTGHGDPVFGRSQAATVATLMLKLSVGTDPHEALPGIQKEAAADFADATVSANVFQEVTGGTNSIQLIFSGPNRDVLQAGAQKVEAQLHKLNGLANISDTLTKKTATVVVRVDSAKAARYGLTTAQVLQAVHGELAGYDAGSFSVGQESFPITVRAGARPDLDALRKLQLPGTSPVVLADVASVAVSEQPVALNHWNLQPYVGISADVTAQDVGSVTSRVADAVAAADLPDNVTAQDVGVTSLISQGFTQMAEAILAAIVIVYMVMLVTFGEGVSPLAILFSLPFAGVGALLALWLAHDALSIPVLIGMLMLIGIVVTNAIVLMDRFRQRQREGEPTRQALLEAAGTRLRPILMTALATMFALIPLAAGAGEGSLISATLAVVVIGGLFTSTLLSLVVVPLAYEDLRWLGGVPRRWRERAARR